VIYLAFDRLGGGRTRSSIGDETGGVAENRAGGAA
jgi:hypothetical protein